MLIKHFENLLKLFDVMISDFVDLRHNCNTLVGWLLDIVVGVGMIDRRQCTETWQQCKRKFASGKCLMIRYTRVRRLSGAGSASVEWKRLSVYWSEAG